MDLSKITEINLEDIFAEINLEIDEINSTVKILCCALENSKYSEPEAENIENILFMLQGKLNAVKNNLRLVKNS